MIALQRLQTLVGHQHYLEDAVSQTMLNADKVMACVESCSKCKAIVEAWNEGFDEGFDDCLARYED